MSAWRLSFLVAWRFNRGRRREGMVSLISVISTLGIALGVAVLIIGLSAMNGFERELKNRILAVVPHGEIVGRYGPVEDWRTVQAKIARTPGVEAAAPFISFTGLVEGGNRLQAVQIKGVNSALEKKLSALPLYVADNAWDHMEAGKQQIILGKGIADQLKIKVGDWVTVMIPNNDAELKLAQPKRIRLNVAGVLQLSGQLDHSLAIVPLPDAQRYLEMGEGVSGIAIKTADPFQVNHIVINAAKSLDFSVLVSSWIGTYGYMYHDIQLIRTIMYLAMFLVIGVACFNIISTLIMAVKDKSGDIAVLRTLGAKDSLIRAVFIWYGLFAGLLGSLVGVLLGVFVSLKLTAIIKGIESLLGHHFLSGDIYFIDFLPTELHAMDVTVVLVTALVLSLLASWYPANRATHIDPARVLSNQ